MLKNRLGNFSRHIVSSGDDTSGNQSDNRYHKLVSSLGGELLECSNGSFVKVISDFDENYFHGKFMIPERGSLPPFRRLYFENCDDTIRLDPDKLLFFDTETTGLGGAGTVAFLIGFGSLHKDGFQVRQYFLPDFPDEEAMLEAVREEIKPDTVLVSYNGRAFDMPILTDRMIIQRVERNLECGDHIDLLHSVRRLYRRRLKSCTLSNVEQNILDFHRIDDTPGYLVPPIYFDWLATDNTTQLEGVVEHNLYDIISLYFIMYHIAMVREEPAERITEPDDVLSLAKIFERRREHENVCRVLEDFDDISHSYDRYDILFLQSLAYKRSGDYEKAVALWKEISSRSVDESFNSAVELAKFYEHKAKDFTLALEFAHHAESILPPRPADKVDIQKRLRRLNRKIIRQSSSK